MNILGNAQILIVNGKSYLSFSELVRGADDVRYVCDHKTGVSICISPEVRQFLYKQEDAYRHQLIKENA